MRFLFFIVLYVTGIVVGGALLAPPLWWLGHWAIDAGFLPALRPFAFDKYFNRAALLLAVVGLPWLFRGLQIKASFAAWGLAPNPSRTRHLLAGLATANVGFVTCVAALCAAGQLFIHPPGRPMAWLQASVAAVCVGVLEEVLFRGVLMGALRRVMPPAWALFCVSVLFAAVHFLRPNPAIPQPQTVNCLSGFALLPHLFWEYGQPQRLVQSFATLTMMALVLGYTVLKTRSLYWAVGLHAGWVWCTKMLALTLELPLASGPWLKNDLRSGLAPLGVMLLSGLWVVWVLRPKPGGAALGVAPTGTA